MSNKIFRNGLTAAAAFTLVLAAPLAAVAQQQNNQPQRGQSESQQQSRGQSQSDRGQSSERGQSQSQRGQNQNRGQSQSGRYRITSTVNVRSGAGTNTRRVGQLRAGQVVSVDQVRNGWLHVQGQGWISASFARRA
ncbi:MAG: SH3 domain-containing protein [Brevundimonas sp.]